MDKKIPNAVKEVFKKFKENNFQLYLVGGAVRDLLMGRKITDWDFTTDAKPEEILKLFPEGFYDNKFGTVGIPLEKSTIEVTTMRREGDYKDHRHPVEVSWTNKIEEDLARRDFTVNALALNIADGEIVDPFDGNADLDKKIIKSVGNPSSRFNEDALRILRAIRIATELGFRIEDKTYQAINDNAALLKNIASERIRDEVFKILRSADPYSGVANLKKSGILKVIIPELDNCFGIVQEGPKHDRVYDIGEHSLLALKYCPSKDPLVLLATLLHDVGKVKTVKNEGGNVTFYNHDLIGGKIVLEIAKRFNLSKKQSDKLFKLVRWHMFTIDEKQTDSAIRRFIKNVGVDNLEDMFDLRIGDRLGGGTPTPSSWRMEKFQERIKEILKKPFSITDLKINGVDVMKILKIKPSRKIGEVLEKLFKEVLDDSSKNDREYLLNRVEEIGKD